MGQDNESGGYSMWLRPRPLRRCAHNGAPAHRGLGLWQSCMACLDSSPGHDVLQQQPATLLECHVTLGAVLGIHHIILSLYVAVVHSWELSLSKADVPPLVGDEVA